MIALDTNVLARFLVKDDEAQSARAAGLIRKAIARDEPLLVSGVTLCELVWVLDFSYQVPRVEIAVLLHQLLRARHLSFPEHDLLVSALSAFEAGRGDFADYVIRAQARSGGCESVATFDKALLKEPGFIAP